MKQIKSMHFVLLFLSAGLLITACGNEDIIEKEDLMEEDLDIEISEVSLLVTAENSTVTDGFSWSDFDYFGNDRPLIDTFILDQGERFDMEIQLFNVHNDLGREYTNIIKEKGDEYMLFFEFTDGIFSTPRGNGNIDNRNDLINYEDEDSNGLPIGLSTRWRAGLRGASPGEFRVILKHQPDLKSETSGSRDGIKEFDVKFPVIIR